MAGKKSRAAKKRGPKAAIPGICCGLCGKRGRLTVTDCCSQPICDDEDKYVMFSYARNSCHRNHSRYTLCGYHYNEGHEGDWRTCDLCRQNIQAEMYVWYGTNEYNFVKLENPPAYSPTHCSVCNRVIRLAEESYSTSGEKYFCESCSEEKFRRLQDEIIRKQ